jgi:hypothetical protein
MNMKDLPPSGDSDSVRCWTVRVNDQGVVLLLVGGECDFDEVWVRPRVLRDEILYFLYGRFSFGLCGD